jgi:hypothetical protein
MFINCILEQGHRRHTARIDAVVLNVCHPCDPHIAVPENRLDDDVGHPQFMKVGTGFLFMFSSKRNRRPKAAEQFRFPVLELGDNVWDLDTLS